MSTGVYRVFPSTMTSGGTLSTEVFVGRSWGSIFLEVPSMNSNSQIHVQAAYTASSSGGTYRRITHPMVNSSTVGTNDFAITSSVTSRMVPIPNGFQYYKVETTATVDNGGVFNIICSDEG